jgi:hypothetical protein
MAIHQHSVQSGKEIKYLLHPFPCDLKKKKKKKQSLTQLHVCLYLLKGAKLEFCGISHVPCTWSVSTTTGTFNFLHVRCLMITENTSVVELTDIPILPKKELLKIQKNVTRYSVNSTHRHCTAEKSSLPQFSTN